MPTILEYSQMAFGVYAASDKNTIGDPTGWTLNAWQSDTLTGYSSGYYLNSQTNEVVISYTGTNDVMDAANWTTGLGLPLPQIFDAVAYYFRVKAAHPNANITFTGHSLGAGLASLMAVFFDKSATVFDEAPFGLAAISPFVLPYVAEQMLINGYEDSAFSTYILSAGLLLFSRASNVTQYYVDDEALEYVRALSANISGFDYNISLGSSTAGAVERHSMALMTALQLSSSFHQVAQKLPDLVSMLLNNSLFAAAATDPNKEDLLRRLLRHQLGVDGAVQPDAMLTRFTSDLWKLAQDGGMTMEDAVWLGYSAGNNVSKALIAFAMQFYYEDTANAIDPNKQLFTDLSTAGTGSNGISFDIADVPKDLNNKIGNGDAIKYEDLVSYIKGFKEYFTKFLDTTSLALLSGPERAAIKSMLPALRDWYVQAGAGGMLAADTQNRGAFMLGGNGNDGLSGGTAADLLVGNGGDDILMGGQGNDLLLGGTGNDTYVYATGDGLDTILDNGGQGSIVMDGATLTGGAQYGDDHVHRSADGKHLYTQVDDKTLVIDGSIIVNGYTAGGLGLTLTAAADNPGTPTLVGDFAPIDQDPGTAGVQTRTDDLGNIITDPNTPEAGRQDVLYGSAYADIIAGAAGSDMLSGKAGDDRLYGDTAIGTAAAIALGRTQTGSGATGDWLNGGAGEDTLVGTRANDLLAGGAGSDLLIGGAGNDALLGDNDTEPANFPAETWHYIASWNTVFLERVLYNDPPEPASSGNDVLYAGTGDDLAFGGYGNDVVFGETGDDILQGNSGNDILLGGNGRDHLYGDISESVFAAAVPGNDYLDGGADDDILEGNEGDDVLIGGGGDDTLYGGAGQDTYVYNQGDGVDTIDDTKAENNILRFGAGVNKDNIKLRLGSLLLDLGNGDAVHIGNFNRADVFNSSSLSGFEFADGSTLSANELLARGFDLEGTAGDDIIDGTNTTDRISGYGGDDVLFGELGSDQLDGGNGNDWLDGGLGDDVLNGGSEQDTLSGGGDADSLFGGAGASLRRVKNIAQRRWAANDAASRITNQAAA